MARADGEACVQIFFIRGGKLIGREYFILEGTEDTADAEVMAEFVKQFYTEAATVPAAGDAAPGDRRSPDHRPVAAVEARRRKGGILRPEGWPAAGTGPDGRRKCRRDPAGPARAVAGRYAQTGTGAGELQSALALAAPPNRIECYDISHTQGVATVGAMVVFEQGVPDKKLYRKFNIDSTSLGAPDDFACMEEVLTRRFKRWRTAQEIERMDPGAKTGCVLLLSAGPDHHRRRQRSARTRSQSPGGVRACQAKSRWWGLPSARRKFSFPHKSESLHAAASLAGALPCPAHPG